MHKTNKKNHYKLVYFGSYSTLHTSQQQGLGAVSSSRRGYSFRQTDRQTQRDVGDWKEGYHKVLCAHPAPVLQHGRRQHAPRHVGHLVSHLKLKLLHERVCFIVSTAHLEIHRQASVDTFCKTVNKLKLFFPLVNMILKYFVLNM